MSSKHKTLRLDFFKEKQHYSVADLTRFTDQMSTKQQINK